MEIQPRNEKFFGRGNPALDFEVRRTIGSFIYDDRGKKFIDFLGGAGVGNLGWEVQEIEQALRKNARPTYVYPNFQYQRWKELSLLLQRITPDGLEVSYRTTGGSESVEAALEMAMMVTGRKKMLSIEGSYHGNTLGALSVGKSSNQERFPNLLSGCEKISPPLNEEKLQEVREILKTEQFAAVIMEPVIINLGVLIPEGKFMKGLDSLCREYGTLLVMDEAITGFGRTGKMFASEHFEIKPDILCMAKAITSGYAGMGAVITTTEISQQIEGKIGLYSSYGWHPIAVDAAIASVNYLLKHHQELFDNIRNLSSFFSQELPKLQFRKSPELRIMGLAIAVDVGDEQYASSIKEKALEEGLLMNTEGTSLLFLPNFHMDKATVSEGLGILNKCL